MSPSPTAYRNAGQSSGYSPFDTNPEPTSNYHAPTIADDPGEPSGADVMNQPEQECQAVFKSAQEAADYAQEHGYDNIESSKKALEKLDASSKGLLTLKGRVEAMKEQAKAHWNDPENPLQPEHMRGIQTYTRKVLSNRRSIPESDDPNSEPSLLMRNLERDLYIQMEALDEAATYALEYGEDDFVNALRKLKEATEGLSAFKTRADETRKMLRLSDDDRSAALQRFNEDRDKALKGLQDNYSAMLEGATPNDTDTDDPETLQLNDFKDEFRALVQELNDTTVDAFHHIGEPEHESKKALEEILKKNDDYEDRFKKFMASRPPKSFRGFLRYRYGIMTWARLRAWLWGTDSSVFFVALSLFCMAYKDGDWKLWVNGLTLLLCVLTRVL